MRKLLSWISAFVIACAAMASVAPAAQAAVERHDVNPNFGYYVLGGPSTLSLSQFLPNFVSLNVQNAFNLEDFDFYTQTISKPRTTSSSLFQVYLEYRFDEPLSVDSLTFGGNVGLCGKPQAGAGFFQLAFYRTSRYFVYLRNADGQIFYADGLSGNVLNVSSIPLVNPESTGYISHLDVSTTFSQSSSQFTGDVVAFGICLLHPYENDFSFSPSNTNSYYFYPAFDSFWYEFDPDKGFQDGLLGILRAILEFFTDTLPEFFGTIIDAIMMIPETILQGIHDAFVPDTEFMLEFTEDKEELLEEQFGAIWDAVDIITDVYEELTDNFGEFGNDTFHFPGIDLNLLGNHFVIDEAEIPYWPGNLEGSKFQSAVRFLLSGMLFFAWITGMVRIYERRFGISQEDSADPEEEEPY